MIQIDCPLCLGEGRLETVSGSYFDSQQYCFYPLEKVIECPECFGCGSIELEPGELELEQAA